MLTGRSVPALDAPRFYAGRMLLALPGMGDPNFDHSKYLAIGESDRMTLRFVKP